jgi:hypothetical protein
MNQELGTRGLRPRSLDALRTRNWGSVPLFPVPIVRQSADHRWQGHITKEGNRYIRWALTESACLAPSKDYALGSFHRRLKARRGNLKARVAVARKLPVAVWYVLTYGEPYKTTAFPTV